LLLKLPVSLSAMVTATCQPSKPDGACEEAESKEIASSVNFLSGGFVSAVSKVIVYPMETKVLLLALGENVANDPLRLWHGVVVKGLENFIYNGLLWFCKERIRPPPPDPSQPDKRPPANFISAFVASSLCTLLVHPLSNTVVGMQASLKNTSSAPVSAIEVASALFKKHGVAGFFKGWQLSLTLKIGSAMTLVIYDLVRVRISGFFGSDVSNIVAGSLGRFAEVLLCHPIKTLRARRQQGRALLTSLTLPALMSLWAGVGTMACADAVKMGIRFGLIERVRVLLQWLLITRRRAHVKVKIDEDHGCVEQEAAGG
jgi:hypothetical protein